jgi:hypothetical protein
VKPAVYSRVVQIGNKFVISHISLIKNNYAQRNRKNLRMQTHFSMRSIVDTYSNTLFKLLKDSKVLMKKDIDRNGITLF